MLILFGEAYAGSGSVLAVHIWAAVFYFLGHVSGKWILAEKQHILSLQRGILGLGVNIALNLLLIPKYGPVGAAWATLLSHAVAGLFVDLFQRRTRVLFYMKLRALTLVGPVIRTFFRR